MIMVTSAHLPLPGCTLLPHIGRQVQPDAVVSAAGCRIDEHLGQWPAQASREPAVPDPPEADPEAHHRYITLSDWEGQGERSPSRRYGARPRAAGLAVRAARERTFCRTREPAGLLSMLAFA